MNTKINITEFFKEIYPEDKVNNSEKSIKTYIEEAEFGFNRIKEFLDFKSKNRFKLLEIGAGSFLLTSYLAYLGFNITALEPVSGGFELFSSIQQTVLEYCKLNNINFNIIDSNAEDFISSEKFDFIFSINVLEHIKEPFMAIDKMKNVLNKDGEIFIHCPNYLIPYEPHFRCFLLPFGKNINEFVFKNKIKQKQELWNDLNFINYNQIIKYVKNKKLFIKFNNKIAYDLLNRLTVDKEFSERMPKLVVLVNKMLLLTKTTNLLKLISPKLQSPMEFIIKLEK